MKENRFRLFKTADSMFWCRHNKDNRTAAIKSATPLTIAKAEPVYEEGDVLFSLDGETKYTMAEAKALQPAVVAKAPKAKAVKQPKAPKAPKAKAVKNVVDAQVDAATASRLDLIKKAAKKVQIESAVKSSLNGAKKFAKVGNLRKSDDVDALLNAKDFDEQIDKMNENHNEWTDAAKYAGEHYSSKVEEAAEADLWNSDY
jgi:hypothetical protein